MKQLTNICAREREIGGREKGGRREGEGREKGGRREGEGREKGGRREGEKWDREGETGRDIRMGDIGTRDVGMRGR
jgi:hypothetical protein